MGCAKKKTSTIIRRGELLLHRRAVFSLQIGDGVFDAEDGHGILMSSNLMGESSLPSGQNDRNLKPIQEALRPGHGGVLQGIKKNTPEIAEIRGVKAATTNFIAPSHSALGMRTNYVNFIAKLRELR